MLVTSQLSIQSTKFSIVFDVLLCSPTLKKAPPPMVTARFDVLFKSLYVAKTINIFLAHFCSLKKPQIFLMLLGIMHAAPPLIKSPLLFSYQQQEHLA